MFPRPAAYYHRVACALNASGLREEAARFQKKAAPAENEETREGLLDILRRMAKESFDKICIFGMGTQGKLLYHELTGRGISVCCFGDNAADTAEGYCGVPCLNVGKLLERKDRLLIIISPDDHSLIQRQLSELGFSNLLIKRELEMPLLNTAPSTGGAMI